MTGSAVIEYLLANHPDTRIRATYHRTEPGIVDGRVEYVKCDLAVKEDCRRAVSSCDCAVMAAAFTGGSKLTAAFPVRHVLENLAMNTNLLEAFSGGGLRRVVYVGSATLYQEFDGFIKESELDLNRDPHSRYLGFGWTARYIEKLCRFLHDTVGMEMALVRASNIFGPRAGFSPENSNFIPALIRKAVDKEEPFEVWGGPGVVRDVVFSEDAARAVVMLLDDERIKFDIFNIGSGVKTTVADAAGWALKHARHEPKKINYVSGGAGTFKFRALDISKAAEAVGWRPRYTVEEGIGKTVAWWREHKTKWTK